MPERIMLDGAGKGGRDFIDIPTMAELMIDAHLDEAARLEAVDEDKRDYKALANVGPSITWWREGAPNPAGKEYRRADTEKYENAVRDDAPGAPSIPSSDSRRPAGRTRLTP